METVDGGVRALMDSFMNPSATSILICGPML